MIVPIVNIKGGVSKTTSCIALACAAGAAGCAVRVLDADPQASARKWEQVAARANAPLPFEVSPANIATIRSLRDDDTCVFVDLPPTGQIVDEVIGVASFVVVPTSPAPIDLAKTFEVRRRARVTGQALRRS